MFPTGCYSKDHTIEHPKKSFASATTQSDKNASRKFAVIHLRKCAKRGCNTASFKSNPTDFHDHLMVPRPHLKGVGSSFMSQAITTFSWSSMVLKSMACWYIYVDCRLYFSQLIFVDSNLIYSLVITLLICTL